MDQLEERYATALALIADPDAAGDIFMAARDEQDLWKRAGKWREQNGYEPLPYSIRLQPLTAEQREHARHLARRAQRKRRALWGLGAAAAALAVVIVGLVTLRASGEAALASDPVFQGTSIAVTDETSGLKMSVFRVEANPGAITVWWSITGRSAAARLSTLNLQLAFAGYPPSGWFKPDEVKVYSQRTDRVLGKSVYAQFARDRTENVFLRMLEGTQEVEGWNLVVPMRRVASDPAAKVYPVTQPPSPNGLEVKALTIAPGYAAVRLPGSSRGGLQLFLETDRALLASRGAWTSSDLGPMEQLVIFPPVPEGAGEVTVFRPAGALQIHLFELGEEGRIGQIQTREWKREGNRISVVVALGPSYVLAGPNALEQARNPNVNRIDLQQEYLGKDKAGYRRWRVYHENLPDISNATYRLRLGLFRMQGAPLSTTIPLVH